MIRNIIFDFGNVLIDINPVLTTTAFIAIFGEENAQLIADAGILEAYEMGQMDEHEFVNTLSNYLKPDQGVETIIPAWNKLLLELPPQRIQLLLDLQSTYQTFLLSNTNYTHMAWIYDYLQKDHNISDWDEKYFQKAYYSHLMGKRKPNEDIFQQVLDEQHLKVEETLFIDDNSYNIETAKRMGFKTVLHDENKKSLFTAMKEMDICY